MDGAELMKVKEVLEENQEITKHSYGVSSVAHHLYIIYNSLQIYLDSNKHAYVYDRQLSDGTGRECKMALWNHPGSDVTGMVARCERMVDTSEKVF